METLNTYETVTMAQLIHKKGLIIAGPCSAENEQQLLRTASELSQTGKVDILRAGIWKPRTTPGGFEGVGTKGLSWLLKAKEMTGLKTAVEVATPKHVEDALNFEVDLLWIGARTSVNPFSIQLIADALRGTEIPVLVKNPVNPDIKLWAGAIERLRKSGLKNLGLIHRGFSAYGNTEYRNVPIWQIPIEMKRIFQDLPLICDPSHITGNRTALREVSQKSVDLDYDGLMIESHYDPDSALTDKNQQITPTELNALLNKITQKKSSSEKTEYMIRLENLRQQIDNHDEELIELISSRMKVSKQIGELKKENKITVLQSSRYNDIIEKAISNGLKVGLSKEFIQSYLEALHIESIRIQNTL